MSFQMDIEVSSKEDFERRLNELEGIRDVLIEEVDDDLHRVDHISLGLDCHYVKTSPENQKMRLEVELGTYERWDKFEEIFDNIRYFKNQVVSQLENARIDSHFVIKER